MLNSDDIIKVVGFYPVVSDLPPGLKQALVNESSPFHALAGTELTDLSAPVTSYGLLTFGTLRVTQERNGRASLLYRVKPGETCILTICNILGEAVYQTGVSAETEIRGVAIPAALFLQMIQQSPVFSLFIFRSFSTRMVGLLDLIDQISFQQLDQRLAGLLLSRGPILNTTHSQLAAELGSVREVISRILKDFELRGLLKLERNQVQVLDPVALEKIAHIT